MRLSAGFSRKKQPPVFDLARIQIASPCPGDWSKMAGDDRVRHCGECNLNVYNLSAMQEQEIQQLLAAHSGKRLCTRFYQRTDGTVMTQDCPWSLRVMRRRVSRLGAAILTAVLSVSFAGAKSKTKQPICDCRQVQQKDSGLKLTVMDQQGAVIPGASVLLENKSNQQKTEGQTGPSGEWQQPILNPGQYSVVIKSQGFRSFASKVKVNDGMLLELKVKLPVADVNTNVVVSAESMSFMGTFTTIRTEPAPTAFGTSGGQYAPLRR